MAWGDEVLLTHNGETHNIRQWAKKLGVSWSVLYQRRKKGLPVEKILAPLQRKKKPKPPKGSQCDCCKKEITGNIWRPIFRDLNARKPRICLVCFLRPGTDARLMGGAHRYAWEDGPVEDEDNEA